MIPASPASNTAPEASNRVQLDTFLLEDNRYERFVYQRRKTRFQSLQLQNDVSKDPLFLLSDEKPWEVFRNGYTIGSRLERRKFVFERFRNFPTLHQACINGDRDQVRSLLSAPKVCVLERDTCGRIALHHAIINGNFKIVRKLLRRRDAKLQVHVRDNSSRTALHYTLEKIELWVLHRRDGLRVPALVTAEMRVESKRYRRMWELADRMLEMFSRRVLEGGWTIEGDSGERIKVLDMRCRGDIWDVCRSGDLERLEVIVRIYGCPTEEWELSELKRTLLHEACENQQVQVVNYFITTMGMSARAQDTSGCTALHCAARRGYLDVCRMLLGSTPTNCCEENLQQSETLTLLQDVRGRTALHWCLLGFGDTTARFQIAMLLVQSCPAVLHICDQDGVSPVHLAIWRGDLELVQEFVWLGANVCASTALLTQPNHGEYVEKSSWAPCGIVFQRRRLEKLEKFVPVAAPVDKAPGTVGSPVCSKKHTPNWENLQHPVEALWYWTWKSSERNFTPNDTKIENKEDEHRDNEPVIPEDELGCRKYGGICSRCELFTTNDSATPSTSSNYRPQLLPPLLLALRMCALKLDHDSTLDYRVAIIELLLTNGAPPDEVPDDGNDFDKVKQPHNPSAQSEGLRVSLRCPQIISMLRHHGAEKVSIDSITQWCFSTSATNAKQAETVLLKLLDLEIVVSSSKFLTMIFCQKHFIALCELWSQNAQNATPKEVVSVTIGRERTWSQGGPPWKSIHETLVSWDKTRKRPIGVGNVDIKHLKFLCGLVHPASEIPADKDDILCDRCVWELFEYCVDMFLRQRSNSCHSNSDFNSKQSGIEIKECEQILLLCIQILFKHWKHSNTDDQRIKSKAASWLEPTIMRGYFDCALVIVETLHRLGGTSNLLDMVFESYSFAIGARMRLENGQFCHHQEFLIVCVENLLRINSTTKDEDQAQSKLTPVASARSIVHTCANNLPFAIVESCFDTVFQDHLKLNVLAVMKAIRVEGKTMAQWILVHNRSDIILWMLKRLPPGVGRGLWWSKLVAASTVFIPYNNVGRNQTSIGFVDNLFSVYLEQIQNHLGAHERKDLLINLMVKYAIPTDSVVLLEQLIKCWESSGSDAADDSETEHLPSFMKSAGLLHSIVRWNAIQVAEFCLSGNCSSSELKINFADWQQIFNEENQQRHELDKCTPLELCRMLGHNHLYNLISAKVSQPGLTQVSAVETDISESAGNSDSDGDAEKEPAKRAHVGLLRNIIEINESLAKNTDQRSVEERFTGYQRYPKIHDPWVSAVVQNQVSHLQALALACLNPGVSVRVLILTAIKNASLNALKWVLETNGPVTTHLSGEEGMECLYAAAKNPGIVYAEMTLLLLENHLNPGRLTGDGMGIPLLHRAACFSNSPLACRIMTILLGRSDCDVNVLDAFGNTAVSYAIAAGCLHNACFLIQNSKCRLEAEYEGQSCFYYALHIVPSFAWRTIVRELLLAKRDRAYLHCDADNKTCDCKGYEHPGEGDLSRPCGFCGHESTSHCIVPLPSWFRDQYDTYIVAANSPRKRSESSSDESADSDGESSRKYLTDNDYGTVGDEDEEIVLENSRGRLDVDLLRRITVLRYDDILHANGLSVTVDSEETVSDGDNCKPTWQVSTENDVSLLEVSSDRVTMEEMLPSVGDLQCVDFKGESISAHRRNASNRKKFTGPFWLRQELAMVHSPRCLCQASAFVINATQLAHVAVCRWLRRTAIVHATVDEDTSSCIVTESAIIALASVQPAFEHWRDVARLDKRSPMIEAVSTPLTPLPRILSSVLFNWRYGKEFMAFQRWKNHRTSAEVAHHRLATRLEHVEADMRRNRFMTLKLRQQQLQESTRSLLHVVSSP